MRHALMSRSNQVRAALVALLIGTAFVSQPIRDDWSTIVFLLFGILNVVLNPRGTQYVRAVAVGMTFSGLLWPGLIRSILAFLAWLVWPPAFLVAWALARESDAAPAISELHGDAAAARARTGVSAIIVAVALASLAYRLLFAHRLQQTAALFIGIPALLALVVVFGVSPRSATGVACKAVTVGLLVSLLLLGEGMLCVAMSAPIFYVVAIGIASFMDSVRRRRATHPTTLYSCLILLIAVPMSLEGVTAFSTVNRDESVAATKIVHASSQEIATALFQAPRFDRALPLYLRAGFPSAVATRIDQEADGARWVIQLRGGEMRLNGLEPRTGELILELEEARPGFVRWRAVSDSSHMTHFLTWRDVVVTWEPLSAETSTVTWTLRYQRGLDPAWYFGPLERYAVRLAASYLIDSVATP
jgi:hypothetical protein